MIILTVPLFTDRGFHFHSVFGSDDVLSKYVGEFGGLKFVVDAKLVRVTLTQSPAIEIASCYLQLSI